MCDYFAINYGKIMQLIAIKYYNRLTALILIQQPCNKSQPNEDYV